MGCCGGSCSCGKDNQTPVQEQVYLAQLGSTRGMLSTHDWMKGIVELELEPGIVEVRFKNNRKEFYRNNRLLHLAKDDRVVVYATGGHDLGTVTLAGELAARRFKTQQDNRDIGDLKPVYRVASSSDLNTWLVSKQKERSVMLKARGIVTSLDLAMHISDVEIRADGKKFTVYYTAEKRVDFRQLIKIFADTFGMKVTMVQIGARQQAARTGGIGSCGRELCCSTWKTNLSSVKLDAAKNQDLSMNASRLAGQCGKLKCCLNYELETYLEAWESFPAALISLETDRGIITPVQANVLKKEVTYANDKLMPGVRYTLTIEQVRTYMAMNKKGELLECHGLAR